MSQQLPSVCVIGAGSSGIAAAKALHERGIPFDCFEKSDRVGGNWVFGNTNGMSSAYRSLHINTSRERMEYTDFPMPKSLSRLPAPHADRRVLRRLRRPLRLPRPDRVRDRASSTPRARRTARWTIALDTRGDAPLRRARRRQRPPLGPALARAAVPGRAFDGEQMHAHHYIDNEPFKGQDASSSSGSATARWTSPSSRASSPSRRSSPPAAAPTSSPSTCSAGRSTRSASTASPARCRGRSAKQIFTAFLRAGVGQDGGLRAAEARPRPRRRAPDDLRRLPQPHRARRDRATSRTSRELTGRPRALRGRHRRGRSTSIVWCTGYKVTFPFFDADLDLRARQRPAAVPPRLPPGHRRTSSSSGCCSRSARSCRSPRRRGSGSPPTCAASTRCRAAPRCGRDMERERAKMFKRYVASKRHTMQVDFDNYLYELGRERRAGARARARARLPPAGRGARRRREAAAHDAARDRAGASAPRRRTAARSSTRRRRSSPRWATARPASATSCAAPASRRARSTTTSRTRRRSSGRCSTSTPTELRRRLRDAARAGARRRDDRATRASATYFSFIVEDRALFEMLRRNAGTVRELFDTPALERGIVELREDLRALAARGELPARSTSTRSRPRWAASPSSSGSASASRTRRTSSGRARFASELFLGGMERLARSRATLDS